MIICIASRSADVNTLDVDSREGLDFLMLGIREVLYDL